MLVCLSKPERSVILRIKWSGCEAVSCHVVCYHLVWFWPCCLFPIWSFVAIFLWVLLGFEVNCVYLVSWAGMTLLGWNCLRWAASSFELENDFLDMCNDDHKMVFWLLMMIHVVYTLVPLSAYWNHTVNLIHFYAYRWYVGFLWFLVDVVWFWLRFCYFFCWKFSRDFLKLYWNTLSHCTVTPFGILAKYVMFTLSLCLL